MSFIRQAWRSTPKPNHQWCVNRYQNVRVSHQFTKNIFMNCYESVLNKMQEWWERKLKWTYTAHLNSQWYIAHDLMFGVKIINCKCRLFLTYLWRVDKPIHDLGFPDYEMLTVHFSIIISRNATYHSEESRARDFKLFGMPWFAIN